MLQAAYAVPELYTQSGPGNRGVRLDSRETVAEPTIDIECLGRFADPSNGVAVDGNGMTPQAIVVCLGEPEPPDERSAFIGVVLVRLNDAVVYDEAPLRSEPIRNDTRQRASRLHLLQCRNRRPFRHPRRPKASRRTSYAVFPSSTSRLTPTRGSLNRSPAWMTRAYAPKGMPTSECLPSSSAFDPPSTEDYGVAWVSMRHACSAAPLRLDGTAGRACTSR